MRKLFRKKISIQFHINRKNDGILLGIQNFNGQLEVRNQTVNVTEIGFFLFSIGIIIQ